MEKRNIELVNEKVSNCKGCKSNCPCQTLAAYMKQVGNEEFSRQFESNTLPNDIKEIYNSKKRKMNL